jgi:hypothetical protein
MKERTMDVMTPTPERIRHGQLEEIETIQAGVFAWQATAPSMLHRYWRDQLLCPEGDLDRARTRFDAGERLASLYDASGSRQRLLGVYGPRSHAHAELTEDQETALKRYHGAVARLTVVSPSVASAVVNLCIHDFDPVDRRELIRGLDALVRHWGLG